MSDHVLLLEEGELAQFAPPGDLFDQPVSEYVARFIGTPSTNVLPTTVEARDGHLVLAGEAFTIPVQRAQFADRVGTDVRIGIRPQYLEPTAEDDELTFPVVTEVVEQLGTEFVVHGETPRGTAVDVVSTDVREVRPGDEIRVGFDPSDVYVFAEDGSAICHGVGSQPDVATTEEA